MIRKIIRIDGEKCSGCGACAAACHEGAIGMVDGKAKLLREDFCDGLGDCLPSCPAGAITFEEREAPEYDGEAVRKARGKGTVEETRRPSGCPGSAPARLERAEPPAAPAQAGKPVSRLAQWPCQIRLAPAKAPFLDGAELLIAADCTAYAYAALHEDFMRGRITLIGCPKLDAVDYSEKLTAILRDNDVRSVTLVRMEVPCCGGLRHAAETALEQSGKAVPLQVVTISRDGRILE